MITDSTDLARNTGSSPSPPHVASSDRGSPDVTESPLVDTPTKVDGAGHGAVIKSTWTPEEDALLTEIVRVHGPKNWPQISSFLAGRSGKQCRERYKNHLDPTVKKTPFTPEEDALIIKLVEENGQKWAYLATKIPGRTDNAIKNRYNSSLRRGHEEGRFGDLAASGIVPSTPPDSPRTGTPMTTPTSSAANTPVCSPSAPRRVYNKRKPSRPLIDISELDNNTLEMTKFSFAKALSTLSQSISTSMTPNHSPRKPRRVEKKAKSAPSSPRESRRGLDAPTATNTGRDADADLAAAVALVELKCQFEEAVRVQFAKTKP